MFEFLRNLVPAFYVKWTDQKKWTDPIDTCTSADSSVWKFQHLKIPE